MSWATEEKPAVSATEAGGAVIIPVLGVNHAALQQTVDDATPLTRIATNGKKFAASFNLLMYRVKNYYWNCYVCLILSASVGVALTFTSTKILSESISVFQIGLVRALFISMVLLLTCRSNGVSLFEPREKLPLVITRGVLGSTGFIFQLVATLKLPLSDAAFMCNSYPVVAAMLSWSFGMESLGFLSWIGISGCALGNALVAHPPFLFGGDEQWNMNRRIGVLSAIMANLMTGIVVVLLRYVGKSVSSLNLTVCMHVFLFLMSVPFAATGIPEPLNAEHSVLQMICYAVLCIAGLLSQLVQSRAMQIGPPTKTTTLLMTNMLFSGLTGVIFLSESISWLSGIGALVILISVVLVTVPDSRKRDQTEERYQPLLTAELTDGDN